MSTISIDENILNFTGDILPLVTKMQFFVSMQQQLYAAFDTYRGDAKKEIDEYSERQMKQLTLMCEGYTVLVSNLIEIINAFQVTDAEFSKKIEAFSSNLTISMEAENDRMKAVLASLGL
ncbi:MAG: hypothetical protein ACRC7V_05640 [Lachnospiraceae bacterium]